MVNVFCLFSLFVLLLLGSLCVVLKVLCAEGDGNFQRTATCFMRAATGEASDTEGWMYKTELAWAHALLWHSNSWFNC